MDRDIAHPAERAPATAQSLVPEYPAEVEALTVELLGHIADKWTMLVLEELADGQPQRFTQLKKAIPGVSQKMLTQTLRQMERLGLVRRQVFAVIPPRVEYQRTSLGHKLGPVVCSLWDWVADHAKEMQAARARFDAGQEP
ncbi:MAG: helix-turn-helix transcriptional regulator [Alphaproteobacteria bacterium]|nr:helix-turn-helix transcriptional regulator [Alphaproteobacteria bacterium]